MPSKEGERTFYCITASLVNGGHYHDGTHVTEESAVAEAERLGRDRPDLISLRVHRHTYKTVWEKPKETK